MTAPAMDRSVAPLSGDDKSIVEGTVRLTCAIDRLLHEDLDQRVSHRVRMRANRFDLVVRQVQRPIAEQFAASRYRNRLPNEIAFEQIVHGVRSCLLDRRDVSADLPGPSRNCRPSGSVEAPVKAAATPQAWA